MYKQNPKYREIVQNDPTAMLPLFNPEYFGLSPIPRLINNASEEKAEALKILENFLEEQQWDVYLAFRKIGPATDWDISRYLGIERTSVCGRRNTLMEYGLIEKHDTIQVERGKRIVQNARWKAVIRIPEVIINKTKTKQE